MQGKFANILETIGNTPVVRINKLAPEHVNLYVKLESFNPGGSVKDRLALGVILDAEKSGQLQPGQTVVEATSGNTGIGLALVCAQRGYPLVIVMAENFSVERRRLMRFLGAKVVLTPAALKGSGMLAKAAELAEKHGWYLTRQFENPANAEIHARTTAREILRDFPDQELDYWITGFGTGGTLNGVSRVLKQESPKTRIVVCEPDNSQLLGSGMAQETIDDPTKPVPSHPAFRPHLMQGWTPDFISALVNQAATANNIDLLMPIAGNDALHYAHALARDEGIFTGISGGATFAGAISVAQKAAPESTLLCMLPDTGERYLSTPLFESIDAEMNADELAIARSTPNYRFDVSNAPSQSEPKEEPGQPTLACSEEEQQLLDEIMNVREQPVKMFALEWCEFCWAIRKLFAHIGVEYQSIDLDSVAYQVDNKGGKLRNALRARTGMATIPQIFIGDTLAGGASDIFDAAASGELQRLLEDNRVSYNAALQINPADFLPNWVSR